MRTCWSNREGGGGQLNQRESGQKKSRADQSRGVCRADDEDDANKRASEQSRATDRANKSCCWVRAPPAVRDGRPLCPGVRGGALADRPARTHEGPPCRSNATGVGRRTMPRRWGQIWARVRRNSRGPIGAASRSELVVVRSRVCGWCGPSTVGAQDTRSRAGRQKRARGSARTAGHASWICAPEKKTSPFPTSRSTQKGRKRRSTQKLSSHAPARTGSAGGSLTGRRACTGSGTCRSRSVRQSAISAVTPSGAR